MRSLFAMAAVAVLVAAGCGGDNDNASPNPAGGATGAQEPSAGGATGPSGPTGGTVPTAPNQTTTQKPKKRTTPPPTLKRKRGSQRHGDAELSKVERYLRDNYSGVNGTKAQWYDRVTRVSVSGETTTVQTDLGRDRKGRRLAGEICQSIIGSVPGSTDIVRVTDPGGRVLEKCVP
jgi:hypothetical protein